jgi:hypothetical protein
MREGESRLEQFFENYLVKKGPVLPLSWKKNLANFLPYLTLVSVILGFPFFLIFFGISFFLLRFTYSNGIGNTLVYIINLFLTAISLLITTRSIPKLFNKKRLGWQLIFYSNLMLIIVNLIAVNLIGIIFLTLSLYLLFQVKNLYK